LFERDYDAQKIYDVGEHVDLEKKSDVLEVFGPHFAKLDQVVKITAFQAYRQNMTIHSKHTLKEWVEVGLLQVVTDVVTDEWLTNYWDYTISAAPSALTSLDRVWRIIQKTQKAFMQCLHFIFTWSPASFVAGALANHMNHTHPTKGTFVTPRGSGVFFNCVSWLEKSKYQISNELSLFIFSQGYGPSDIKHGRWRLIFVIYTREWNSCGSLCVFFAIYSGLSKTHKIFIWN